MLKDTAILFKNVTKTYPSYQHVTGGIKTFLFNLNKSISELRRRTIALDDISLEIPKGESFGFIGRNGAGKSTSLGMIAGVLSPNAGKVVVNGRVSPLLELGAGFHAELTGRENILLNGVLMGLRTEQVQAQMDAIVEFSELGAFIEQPVRTYSSGMYAKLGFSVVANLSPEILLVDEILAVGDHAFAEKCIDKFEQFKSDPLVTIVLVSHSPDAVKKVCDRVAWIDGHRLKMIGPSDEVVDAYLEDVSPKTRVSVLEHIKKLLPYVAASVPYVECSNEPVSVPINLTHAPAGTNVYVSLIVQETGEIVQKWSVSGEMTDRLSLSMFFKDRCLKLNVSEECSIVCVATEVSGDSAVAFEMTCCQFEKSSFALGFHTEGPDWNARGHQTFCPVFRDMTSRIEWERRRGELIKCYGQSAESRAPLWPENCTVRIVARNVFLRDAVGHFVLGLCGMLSRAGVPARIYAYVSSAELAGIVQPITALKNDTRSEDIVFYNFSIEDEFLDMISSLTSRKVLYYHNVTPSEWFRPYNSAFADVLDQSREQFSAFDCFDAVLANSEFSLEEIKSFLRKGVLHLSCPPTLNPDRLLSAKVQSPPDLSGRVILWVGRMVPHKRPDVAVKIFEEMSRQRSDLSLVMVGSGFNDFPAFSDVFHASLESLPSETQDRVTIFEGVEDSALRALYLRADVFLCTSAHEGFCVPLYEAMSFGVPVVALPQPAVVETLHGAGSLLPENITEAAAQLTELIDDAEKLKGLKEKSLERSQDIRESLTGEKIWSVLNEVVRLRQGV